MNGAVSASPTVLYLITSPISLRLLSGQLEHVTSAGFDVVLASALEHDRGTGSPPPGVRTMHIPFTRRPAPLADLRCLIATIRLIRRVKPDIVNSSTPKAGLIGTIAAFLMRIPVRVYVVRGLRFQTLSGPARTLLSFLERVSMRLATHVVFNSRSLMEFAIESRLVEPDRARILGAGSGNGVKVVADCDLISRHDARTRLGLKHTYRYIGYIGRLTKDKGIEDLFTAWGYLKQDWPEIHLVLVGDFEPDDPVDAGVRDALKTDPRVIHFPWLDDVRVPLSALEALLLPSYREGLPNIVLEAQMNRVPVVAYAATGTVDAVQDGVGGFLVPVGKRSELYSRVSQLLADGSLAELMGASGRTWVCERFSQERIWFDLMALYRSALSGS